MNERERLLHILNGQQPDRVPWFGDLTYWTFARIRRGELPPDFLTSSDYYNWHSELRVGFYLQGYEPYVPAYENMEVREWVDGNDRFREIITPNGTLRERWHYLPESFTEGPAEYLVKSVEDLPALEYFFQNTRYRASYGEAFNRRTCVRDLGIVLCYLPQSPLMCLVVLWAGIETVVRLYVEARNELERLLFIMERKYDEACEVALDSPAECLMIPENLSSEIIGKTLFEAYVRPYQEKWVERIRGKGKYSFIHMDGTLKGLLREVASVGFDVLEARTPKPSGDLSIYELADIADNESTILWGGIPGTHFTQVVSDEEFERHTKEVLGVMRQEPRHVLGVADQIPPNAVPSRVSRVADLVDKYGRYE